MKRRRDDDDDWFWMEQRDIDALAEYELTQAGLYPTQDKPAVDIERFIEKHLGAHLDHFANLPPRVVGQTAFFVEGPPHVQINRELAERAEQEKGGALGRVRITMAHEAFHIMMHSRPFTRNPSQLYLLEGDMGASTGRLFRCDEDSVSESPQRGRRADWREIQANMGMASLLMPKEHFIDTVLEELEQAQIPRYRFYPEAPETRQLVARVAQQLLVSKQAVLIRLQELELLVPSGQKLLAFPEPDDQSDSF